MSIEHTEEDWAAWIEENPWDEGEDWVTDTLGFAVFVLDRRTSELGGLLRVKFERLRDRIGAEREKLVRRYFQS